jgi:hypothetical protein
MEGKNQSIDVRKRVIISDNVPRRKNQQKVLKVTVIETDPEVMVVVAGKIVLTRGRSNQDDVDEIET